MDFFAPSPWLGIIARGALARGQDGMSFLDGKVADIIAMDGALKPANYNDVSRGSAQRYIGDQRALLAALLEVRYPRSAPYMPNAPLTYIRHWARQDAGAYDQEPNRTVYDTQNSASLEDSDELALEVLDVLARARIDEVAPETERRALTPTRAAVVHASWLPPVDGRRGRVALHHFWVHDTVMVIHPQYGAEEEGTIFAALRQSSLTTGKAKWRCYRRRWEDDEFGHVKSWGLWEWGTYDEETRQEPTWVPYRGTVLPVARLLTDAADSGAWPAPDRDSLQSSDQLNTSRSNLDFVIDMQGHSNLVVADDTYEEKQQAIGPESVINLRTDGTASYISPAPAIESMQGVIEERQRAVGAVRGNNPNTYVSSVQAPESGIARQIQQLPHERRLRELRPAVKRFDEQLCRVILDITDAFDDDAPFVFGDRYEVVTELAPTRTFEDPEAKQRMALIDLDMGVISPAEYAVQRGLYSSAAAAIDDGLSGERRAAAVQAPPVEDPAPAVEAPQAAAVLDAATELEPEDAADLDAVAG